MSTTPRTDARELAISIQNEDSCCAIYVKIDGKEYEGGLVDSDFARKLECENARLRETPAKIKTAVEPKKCFDAIAPSWGSIVKREIDWLCNSALSPAIHDSKP